MSFQGYLTNIHAKTGKTPEDFRLLATKKGFIRDDKLPSDVKVGTIVDWLKRDFKLGHGHAMAIVAYFKGMRP